MMKPSVQLNKSGSSNKKSKQNSKDREKKKPPGGVLDVNNHNSAEKGSPTKDSSMKLYAGIDSESLTIYAEQTGIEHLTDEVTNILTEDINYRLRYIINDSLIKARLSGRNAINSQDIEQTFENLQIDKVYGASSHPNWVPFGYQNLYYLDDKQVNLVEIAREENVYYQYSETILTKKWITEQKECNKALKNYFTTMCQMIVSNDKETRQLALNNIRENHHIGSIIEWFYNFSYILLSKDITYDCLTLRALDLITVLETSNTCRVHVSEKQLKLLVRLILQRLLKSATTFEILKPMCYVLAILCERLPLMEFVLLKIQQKLNEVFDDYDLPIITIINCLGVEAIKSIFLPNLQLFLNKVAKKEPLYIYSILESYYVLHKEDLIDSPIYNVFFDYFGENLLFFIRFQCPEIQAHIKKDLNLAHVKCELFKLQRKIDAKCPSRPVPIEDVFDMPQENSKLKRKLEGATFENHKRQTSVVIGRTTLLLPVFQQKKSKCHTKQYNHMLWYNL